MSLGEHKIGSLDFVVMFAVKSCCISVVFCVSPKFWYLQKSWRLMTSHKPFSFCVQVLGGGCGCICLLLHVWHWSPLSLRWTDELNEFWRLRLWTYCLENYSSDTDGTHVSSIFWIKLVEYQEVKHCRASYKHISYMGHFMIFYAARASGKKDSKVSLFKNCSMEGMCSFILKSKSFQKNKKFSFAKPLTNSGSFQCFPELALQERRFQETIFWKKFCKFGY